MNPRKRISRLRKQPKPVVELTEQDGPKRSRRPMSKGRSTGRPPGFLPLATDTTEES